MAVVADVVADDPNNLRLFLDVKWAKNAPITSSFLLDDGFHPVENGSFIRNKSLEREKDAAHWP